MKKLIVFIFFSVIIFSTAPLFSAILSPQFTLPTFCDQEYDLDAQKVGEQFAGFARPVQLKGLEEYMTWVKQYEDLNFNILALENKSSTETVAKLRTPATHYNDCRNQRVVHSNAIGSDLCDVTYAVNMKAILAQLARSSDPELLQQYSAHMENLKHQADVGFKIHAFETKDADLAMIAKLRSPLVEYWKCRDTIIRTFAH